MVRKRKQKKSSGRIFSSKIFLFLLIIIAAGAGKLTFDKYYSWTQAKSDISEVEKEIETEKQKNANLKQQASEAQNNEYLENVIKEKLNLVKPGEKVIYVLPENEEPPAKEKEETMWEKVKDIFMPHE